MTTSKKKCTICKGEYLLTSDFFHRDRKNADGFNERCKMCRKKYLDGRRDIDSKKHREYYRMNKEKIKNTAQQYRVKNPDKVKDVNKKYRENNVEKVREINRDYAKRNKKKIRTYSKIYRRKNALDLKRKKHQYYIDNREKIFSYQKYIRKTNANYRMASNLRSRLWSALKSQNVAKTNHTMDLVGCSRDFLKKHLESQFTNGMSWQNYGRNGWHIDHIIPCAFFNLVNPKEQRRCFNYKNMRPMWEKDNFSKNSYYKGKRFYCK